MGFFKKATSNSETPAETKTAEASSALAAAQAAEQTQQTPAETPKPVTETLAAPGTIQAVEQTQQTPAQPPKPTAAETKTLQPPAPAVVTSQLSTKPVRPEIRPHAFVVMPFGKKKGGDGSLYDFNAIYLQLIKPTLEAAGFEAFRADEATTSGDILTDMFQELLLADLCLADMSIDNANVFYELGIRHAFRKRGIIHIQAGRSYMPFDIFNVRTIPYHVTPEGVPDPDFLEKDKQGIARVCRDTWASDPDAIHSPIFNLLTGLIEPDRKTLRTPLATGFWREYNEWKQRVTISQRQHRIGDILLLTEEISNPLIKEEAVGEAGKALQNMGRNELALEQYRKGLEINPRNLNFRRQEAIFLNRLGRVEEAIVKLENLLADVPNDTESIGTLGRIYKDMWSDSWKWIKNDEKRMKTAFESYHWLVKAFNTYLKGYHFDLDNTYPGVNALTLGTIVVDLADRFDDKEDPDPDITKIRMLLPELRGTLLFALDNQAIDESVDYWTLVSLAELHVMTSERTIKVTRAYRKALTAARRNTFFLESSLQQLEILESLGMRPEYVRAGMKAIHNEIHRLRKEEEDDDDDGAKKPDKAKAEGKVEGNVFLFCGYMISNARKKGNQFPPEREPDIKAAINKVLEKYNAGPQDMIFTTGMDAGSEIIFVEQCVERGIPVRAFFPIAEAAYVRDFVSPGGDQWTERFYRMRNHPLVDEFYQPDHVGLPKPGDDMHERNNRWTVYSALLRGIDKLRLIAFWDGKSEPSDDLDSRLVKHMVDLMRDMGGQIEHINSTKLLADLQPARDSAGHTPQRPASPRKKED